jgi:hypothetical protein
VVMRVLVRFGQVQHHPGHHQQAAHHQTPCNAAPRQRERALRQQVTTQAEPSRGPATMPVPPRCMGRPSPRPAPP